MKVLFSILHRHTIINKTHQTDSNIINPDHPLATKKFPWLLIIFERNPRWREKAGACDVSVSLQRVPAHAPLLLGRSSQPQGPQWRRRRSRRYRWRSRDSVRCNDRHKRCDTPGGQWVDVRNLELFWIFTNCQLFRNGKHLRCRQHWSR